MKQWMVDKLLRQGVFTPEEYNEFMSHYSSNERGELIGGISCNDKLHWKYELAGDPLNGNLLDFVINDITPPLGAEDMDPIFKKYGYSSTGICDGWVWFRSGNLTEIGLQHGKRPIDEASELELWKIIALSSRYWQVSYERWYDEAHNITW